MLLRAASTAQGWGEAAFEPQPKAARVEPQLSSRVSRVSVELLIFQHVGFLLTGLCDVSKEQSTGNALLR